MISQNKAQTNKTILKQWMQYVQHTGSELTPVDIANHLSIILSEDLKNNKAPIKKQQNNENDIQILWRTNQYFYESMVNIGEDILYYVYAADSLRRKNVPKCLVGYYQVVKNFLYLHDDKQPTTNNTKIKYQNLYEGSQQLQPNNTPEYQIPPQLKIYLQNKILQILFNITSIHELQYQLTKFYDSNLIQKFKKQLYQLIQHRINKFEVLYQVTILQYGLQIFHMILFMEGQVKIQDIGQICIDQMLICLVYLIYKINKQIVILGKIIEIYQEHFQTEVNRVKILNYFNQIFLTNFYNKLKLTPTTLPKNENPNKKIFIGNQIKDQKSLFDMFQE